MAVPGAGEQIRRAVLIWPDVDERTTDDGSAEYQFAGAELGQVIGDNSIDVPLTKRVRDKAIADERAEPHPTRPNARRATLSLHHPNDVNRAIALLRLSYDLISRRRDSVAKARSKTDR